jgi:hypothetical protein
VKVILTAGQAHDLSRAKDLITGHKPASVIAEKGEDSNEFVAAVEAQGAQAVIPPRSTRKTPREDDKPLDQGAKPGRAVPQPREARPPGGDP